jgi:hypothetical protein
MESVCASLPLVGVIPAKAGIQLCVNMHGTQSGIPAFAGMTPPWG